MEPSSKIPLLDPPNTAVMVISKPVKNGFAGWIEWPENPTPTEAALKDFLNPKKAFYRKETR